MLNYELYKRHTLISPKSDHGFIECVYNVNNVSNPISLFHTYFRLYKVRKLEIDGVEQGPEYTHVFPSLGEHVVKVYLNDRLSEADNIFDGCSNLVSVKFCIDSQFSIGSSTFKDCTSLVSVDWNNSPIVFSYNSYMFDGCKKLTNIDLIKPTIESSYFYRSFKECNSLSNIVFPKTDNGRFHETFWGINNSNLEIDLSNISKISLWDRCLGSMWECKKLNFGECDLSTADFDREPFLEYSSSYVPGEVILLGTAMNYNGWVDVWNRAKGRIIYNLEYDYSDLFFENPNCTPIANKSVNKTLKIRFCTNDNWLTGSSHVFKINNVVGTYTSQGIYEFSITADTYQYPIYYNNTEIGTAIVKDEIQQICFGNNPNVYKVIDFSSEDSFDQSIIESNEGWSYQKTSDQYYGLCNPFIDNGKSTNVVLNTGMTGDIYLTLAQSSQTYYHYCIISNNNSTLNTLNGHRYQSHYIKGIVNITDGSLKFTYRKNANIEGKDPTKPVGYDKIYIKKLENYNWPELPA